MINKKSSYSMPVYEQSPLLRQIHSTKTGDSFSIPKGENWLVGDFIVKAPKLYTIDDCISVRMFSNIYNYPLINAVPLLFPVIPDIMVLNAPLVMAEMLLVGFHFDESHYEVWIRGTLNRIV